MQYTIFFYLIQTQLLVRNLCKRHKEFMLPPIVTQNKILRILQLKSIKTPSNRLYRELGFLKLRDLHDFGICCIFHKFIHFPHLCPDAFNTIFCRNEQIHHYETRNKKSFILSKWKQYYMEKNDFIAREKLLEQITQYY